MKMRREFITLIGSAAARDAPQQKTMPVVRRPIVKCLRAPCFCVP
jgi:hypothetical protein